MVGAARWAWPNEQMSVSHQLLSVDWSACRCHHSGTANNSIDFVCATGLQPFNRALFFYGCDFLFDCLRIICLICGRYYNYNFVDYCNTNYNVYDNKLAFFVVVFIFDIV